MVERRHEAGDVCSNHTMFPRKTMITDILDKCPFCQSKLVLKGSNEHNSHHLACPNEMSHQIDHGYCWAWYEGNDSMKPISAFNIICHMASGEFQMHFSLTQNNFSLIDRSLGKKVIELNYLPDISLDNE